MINQHNLCCQKLIHISRPETHDDDMQIFNKRTKKTGSQLYLLHNNKTSSVFKAALTVENDYY